MVADENMDGETTILLFILQWAVVPLFLAVIEAFRRIFGLEKREALMQQAFEHHDKRGEELLDALNKHNDDVMDAVNRNADRLTSIEQHLRSHG